VKQLDFYFRFSVSSFLDSCLFSGFSSHPDF